MNFEAAIFDMDGVIIDSEPFWQDEEVRVYNKYGLPVTLEQTVTTRGLRTDEIVSHWMITFGREDIQKEEILQELHAAIVKRVKQDATLLPGVIETMTLLKNMQLKIAIASSSADQIIDAVVDAFELRPYLNATHSAYHERRGKPDPAVYITTATLLGVSPQKCIAVEDSVNGMQAAKAAGMTCIVIPSDGREPRMAFEQADLRVSSLLELTKDILLSLHPLGV
ncbi:MAG: 2-deoxyglucose-6-phosphatase [Candidatus Magasanikbacteria bacterium CG10_big_fil_rev_8_21_14_0_10_47_10]|uniref:2-deoxyglucose-6-phosphatase n=1 Tax=Candidatus Magasanikbacteria bacterium CG10_big_fil_rev_8_21_14_0_10_47_10 TaxID=1974652 RepID=A0A2H0TSZ1_9BACT|nr:MAG: 2-deoxyglucose-6-phosphatase [Candidatus Magasanikbacteria bacterium CG10_big_fil_rev_8_21_14_0_10_47_10]